MDSTVRHLTTTEVADLFSVDPKTIHNWVARGMLRAWRTAGGHKRFGVVEVADACGRFGRDVPRWVADAAAIVVAEETNALRAAGRPE